MLSSRFISIFFLYLIINMCMFLLLNFELKNRKLFAFCGCMISLMIITAVCFFPLPFQDNLIQERLNRHQELSNNFIPFKTLFTLIREAILYKAYGNVIYQLVGNIILFIPLGFSLSFLLTDDCVHLKKGIVGIIFTSLSIEAFQWILGVMIGINYRSVDIDDVILNVFGGILGLAAASYVKEKYSTDALHKDTSLK